MCALLGSGQALPGSDPREVPSRWEKMGRVAVHADRGRRSTQTKVSEGEEASRVKAVENVLYRAGSVRAQSPAPGHVSFCLKVPGSLTSIPGNLGCVLWLEDHTLSNEELKNSLVGSLVGRTPSSGDSPREKPRKFATVFLSCGGSWKVAHEKGNPRPSWSHQSRAGAG